MKTQLRSRHDLAVDVEQALDSLHELLRADHHAHADGEMLIRRADAAMFSAKRARSAPTFCDGMAR